MSLDLNGTLRTVPGGAKQKFEHDGSTESGDRQVRALERIALALSAIEEGQNKHLEKLETQNELVRRIIHVMSGRE